MNNLPVV